MTYQVYRSYLIVALLFALLGFSPLVNADARCNQDIGTAHYPYTTDTDDEYKYAAVVGLKEVTGTGAVACYAQTLLKDVIYRSAPEPVTIHSNQAGGDCTMVNDDGTEATVGSWQSKVTRSSCTLTLNQNPNQARCDVMYELWCGRFTPRVE